MSELSADVMIGTEKIGTSEPIQDENGKSLLKIKIENWAGLHYDEEDPDSIYVIVDLDTEGENNDEDE